MKTCIACNGQAEGKINGQSFCKHHLVLVRKKQIEAYVKSKRLGKLLMILMTFSLMVFSFSLGMLTNYLTSL